MACSVLGTIGNEETVKLLEQFTQDGIKGAGAIETIVMIRKRLRFATPSASGRRSSFWRDVGRARRRVDDDDRHELWLEIGNNPLVLRGAVHGNPKSFS